MRGWVNIIYVALQTLGQTFPSLSQTGEGFLLRFERGASPCPEQGRSARTLAVVGVGVLRCPNEGSRHAPVAARHPHRTRTRAANRVFRELRVAFFFQRGTAEGAPPPPDHRPGRAGRGPNSLLKFYVRGVSHHALPPRGTRPRADRVWGRSPWRLELLCDSETRNLVL